MSDEIAARVERVLARIEAACRRSGRRPEDVTLVAVTKAAEVDAIRAAIAAGVRHIAENRVQDARRKFAELGAGAVTHLIGHLQTNKARLAAELFDWIHSVDRLRLAQALSKRATERGVSLNCLIQVNVSGEESKHGVRPEDAPALCEAVGALEGLRVQGLMTIAPYGASEKELRAVFGGLRRLAEEIAGRRFAGVHMNHLSMGMSDDFETAIEEGATMVRVGSAIFAPREV